MRINHNISAMNAYRMLTLNNSNVAKSLEKLSSGLRINRAGDDAAGLAISEKMRGQIRGLDMAVKNAQDGISLIQTAEGALNETHAILQRMRELAVQAANDTNTAADRLALQKEIDQLKSEIDRIASTTEFNTKKLLDGTVGISAVLKDDKIGLKTVSVVNAELPSDTYKVTIGTAATVGVDIKTNTTGLSDTDFDFTAAASTGLKLGDYKLVVKDAATAGFFDFYLYDKNGVEVARATNVDFNDADGDSVKDNAVLTGANGVQLTIKAGSTVQAGEMTLNINAKFDGAGDFAITNTNGGSMYSNAAGLKITDSYFEAGGFAFDLTIDAVTTADTSDVVVTNNALTMHIGANTGQTMKIDVNKMDTTSLRVKDVDVTTQDGAETAITTLNTAIEKVSAERAKLGAFQNRLEHTINNLGTASENLSAAESRIRDVDMAKEMMEFTKNSILTQAAQAMLAQANQVPQGVLQLLR
ncbi:flagellin [Hydrogenibacillus sp. N12]|uniref:flagellin N-terminal helical domain-containing protein n=1 Tax=Hydrogenibacillus sp. N12 TaxID=2866627 RepID=UPI001C7D9BDF|nr:flagellin [Hydrogenibacillus sp. N12]QZA33209.1 flagellin [Hydrogenibacillus sp. N12]